jgi:hypothetical protein
MQSAMKQKTATVIVYICAASSFIAIVFPTLTDDQFPGCVYRSTELPLIASASALLIASVIIFRRPRISYWLGLISGLGVLYWFRGIEFGYSFPALNTWVAFNLPDTADYFRVMLMAKLRIALAIAALAVATVSATRLLPSHWTMRKLPVRDQLWPSLAICVLAAVFWYVFSVSPYRIPWIVDAVSPKLTLLHVEKNGGQFNETGISILDDGRVYLSHNDRRLFHYRFPVRIGSTILSQDTTTRKAAFALAQELANADTAPAVPLRSENAEGWYVRTQHRHVLAFTTENGSAPPAKLISVFHSLESVIPPTKPSGDGKDICFGFCYDPLAGLGIVYMNERCTDGNGTRCK